MTTVEEAKKLLAEAELKEKINYRKKELEQLKKDYEGKCFATNTFERRSRAKHWSLVYYESFFIEDTEIFVLKWYLRSSKYSSYIKPNKYLTEYSKNITKDQLTGLNEYHAFYNLNRDTHYTKEISKTQFDRLWHISEDITLEIAKGFYTEIPEVEMELIRQGDASYESTIEKCIEYAGLDFIDLKDYPEVLRHLEFVTLPMFDKNRWLPRDYTKPILEWYIRQLEIDNANPYISINKVKHNMNTIRTLKKFIEDINLKS